MSGRDSEGERFAAGRRGLAVLYAVLAVTGFGLTAHYLAVGDRWFLIAVWAAFGLVHAVSAVVHGRQHVTVTADHLEVTRDLRTQRVPWADVERVVLDWAAAAAGRDPDAFRVERRSGPPERSAAVMGLVGDRADELEAALRQRGDEHGFEVEVHRPSWAER